MSRNEVTIKINLDTEDAERQLQHLKDLADAVPVIEYDELGEATFSWPWLMLFLASVGGGLTVLLAFWLIGSVFA